MLHIDDFKTQQKLHKLFDVGNGHLVWVMSMYLDEPDPEQLGIDCLTDQPDDKKLDFVFLDRDGRRVVFAQGYYTEKTGGSAPANKASDLNTAAAWLISGDLSKVPDGLADLIREARAAIDGGEIDQVELLYVHNMAQSKNVAIELDTARKHLEKGLVGKEIQILASELGLEECERLFVARESGILVRDKISVPAKIAFEESGPHWRAGLVSLPARWLFDQFHQYGQALFSANYRGFLGVSKRRKINAAIRQTAETSPKDFWVFNNGITLLTLDYGPTKDGSIIEGCSIINGAQTTGSLGQIADTKNLSDVKVLARIVACGHQETVRDIVRFNNTQNEITTWDQYSNTETQKRLADEFTALGHSYSLKRGFGQSISGLGIEVVAQPLLAFDGALDDAVRGKNTIFDRKTSYNRAFEGKSARHILFVYTLALAIDNMRAELKELNRQGKLIKAQEKELRIARNVRFKYFFMAVIASALEATLKQKISIEHIAFNEKSSLSKSFTVEELAGMWRPVVGSLFSLLASQITKDPAEVLSDSANVAGLSETLGGIALAANLAEQPALKKFAGLL
jgi:AIPR protein